MTPLPRISTCNVVPPCRFRSSLSAAYIAPVMAPTKARQDLVADGAALRRHLVRGLMGAEKFHEIARLRQAGGKGADVDRDAVHGDAPQERKPRALVPGGAAAAQGARPAVAV